MQESSRLEAAGWIIEWRWKRSQADQSCFKGPSGCVNEQTKGGREGEKKGKGEREKTSLETTI